MACSVLGAVCIVQACVLVVWSEKLYGSVTFVRAFLSRTKGPKEPEPFVVPLAELRPTVPLLTPTSIVPIPGPALTSETIVSVVPESEPVLPPRPNAPAPPSLPPRYRSQEASVSSGSGSFALAEDHLYEPIQQPLNVIRQTGIKYYKTFLLLKLVVVNLRILII